MRGYDNQYGDRNIQSPLDFNQDTLRNCQNMLAILNVVFASTLAMTQGALEASHAVTSSERYPQGSERQPFSSKASWSLAIAWFHGCCSPNLAYCRSKNCLTQPGFWS